MKKELNLSIIEFEKSGREILKLWNKDMDELDKYPFNESFDEVVAKISIWLENYEENVK